MASGIAKKIGDAPTRRM